MTTASNDELLDLWKATLKGLQDALNNSETCTAFHLNVARQFLKDNGITISKITGPRDGAEALGRMINQLPEDFDWPKDDDPMN